MENSLLDFAILSSNLSALQGTLIIYIYLVQVAVPHIWGRIIYALCLLILADNQDNRSRHNFIAKAKRPVSSIDTHLATQLMNGWIIDYVIAATHCPLPYLHTTTPNYHSPCRVINGNDRIPRFTEASFYPKFIWNLCDIFWFLNYKLKTRRFVGFLIRV